MLANIFILFNSLLGLISVYQIYRIIKFNKILDFFYYTIFLGLYLCFENINNLKKVFKAKNIIIRKVNEIIFFVTIIGFVVVFLYMWKGDLIK